MPSNFLWRSTMWTLSNALEFSITFFNVNFIKCLRIIYNVLYNVNFIECLTIIDKVLQCLLYEEPPLTWCSKALGASSGCRAVRAIRERQRTATSRAPMTRRPHRHQHTCILAPELYSRNIEPTQCSNSQIRRGDGWDLRRSSMSLESSQFLLACVCYFFHDDKAMRTRITFS